MRFHIPFLLALTTTLVQATPVATTDLTKRDGAAVIDAVAEISSGLVSLNETVTAYRGGISGTLQALQIEFQTLAISNDLRAGILITKLSRPFTEDESLHVSAAFVDLVPVIFSTLDNLVSKKPQFDTGLLGIGSLSFLVLSNLETQAELSARLGEAVVEKLTDTFDYVAPLLNAQIAAKFEETIAAYS
ncbi:hydrophobic surface binding protein A-domain-containing protein [Aspergillus egyptiacus]|nr:hydrophobic surface binding protein A-domain-containing protein [Aspergillus egyptiacus]